MGIPEDWVARCESGDLGVVLHVPKGPVPDGYVPKGACSEVVFFYLEIEVLAGESRQKRTFVLLQHEGVLECAVIVYQFTERLVRIVAHDVAVIVNHQAH